ncbi:MAG: hemerythrin domain-containing protein [Usitatibacter sp.]
MHYASMPSAPPANDASDLGDIRVLLRRDHDLALQELEALRTEKDERRCRDKLERLRRAWALHALAEETVVYRALESIQWSERADGRFVEHGLVGGLFEKLAQARPNSREWNARLQVVRDLIVHHIEGEHSDMFPRLSKRFDPDRLAELGERFRVVQQKLEFLEQAKAA